MKILVLSNLYPPDVIGGYEIVCEQVVDALRERGHELLVLTSSPRCPVPAVPHVHRRLELVNVYEAIKMAHVWPVLSLPYYVRSSFINAHNVHGLLATLETFTPDVVYLHNLLGLGGLGLLGCLHHLRLPWVWQLGDHVPRQLCSLGREAVPSLVSEFNRQLRGHYMACSTRVVQEIEDCGLHIGDQVELLSNWVHGPRPAPRTTYFDSSFLRIVSAGQISRAKGIDLLIESAAQLRRSGHDNFCIDLYGNADDPFFQVLIDKSKVRDHVILKGALPQERLFSLLRAYDVFAFPTWSREPFGCAPLEAALRGCVPVLSADCGISEWLVNGVHCLKAERSAEAFTRVFADILDGKIDLAPMGRRVAAVVSRDFHLDTLLPRIEQALANAARQPRTGAGTAAEAYRLALLAEKIAEVSVHETACA